MGRLLEDEIENKEMVPECRLRGVCRDETAAGGGGLKRQLTSLWTENFEPREQYLPHETS
jgi:hypothetical protein